MSIKKGGVVSVDVSKSDLTFQPWLGYCEPAGKPKKLPTNLESMSEIYRLAKDVGAAASSDPVVAIEDTGVYGRPLLHYLEEAGVKVARMSPLLSSRVGKADDKRVKTDAIDCSVIAEAYYTKDKVTGKEFSVKSLDAQDLSRMLRERANEAQSAKCRFRKTLDLVWPLWDRAFPSVYAKGPWAIVKEYLHPSVLAGKRTATVARMLESNGIHGERAAAMAEKAIAYAKSCQSGAWKCSVMVDDLRYKMSILEAILADKARIEDDLADRFVGSDSFRIATSMPGVGRTLALLLLAEIGDPSRFRNAKAIVSYAGFEPRIYGSGVDDGKHRSISKKGNARLRWAATMAVRTMTANRSKNAIASFKERLINANHLSAEAAIVAAASKLLRILLVMLKSGQEFKQD